MPATPHYNIIPLVESKKIDSFLVKVYAFLISWPKDQDLQTLKKLASEFNGRIDFKRF